MRLDPVPSRVRRHEMGFRAEVGSMTIPVQSRWWIATLVIVGALVLISALALDKPNTVWAVEKPYCPFCRHEVQPYSSRCADCNGEFDWVVCPEEQSPICADSLSVLQAEWVAGRIEALGPERAIERVARATGLSADKAEAYLHSVGRGDCGWCGGTKVDLASDKPLEDAEPCPACLGTGRCTGCGGDRRVRLGDPAAARALGAYRAELADLVQMQVPMAPERARAEARRLAQRFLESHAGTREAHGIFFWQTVDAAGQSGKTVAEACRARLERVARHLQDDG